MLRRELRFPTTSPLAQPVQLPQEDTDLPKQEEAGEAEALQLVESNPLDEPVLEEQQAEEEQQIEEQTKAISRRVAESVENLRNQPITTAEKPSWLKRFIFICLFSAIAYQVHEYQVEAAAIGYCDAGTRTSRVLEEAKARHSLAKECVRQNRTTLYPPNDANGSQELTPCPLPPIIPLPQPETCTPCPEHASCSQFRVTCDTGYQIHPNPFVFFLPTPPASSDISFASASSPSEHLWAVLYNSLNGLPGFGSTALPPRCLEDPKRKLHIGALGKAIESTLGKERGRRICLGIKDLQVSNQDGGEAKEWGVELTKLKDIMRKKTSVRRSFFSDLGT